MQVPFASRNSLQTGFSNTGVPIARLVDAFALPNPYFAKLVNSRDITVCATTPAALMRADSLDPRARRGRRPDVKRISLGPYEKADTSRWNFRFGGAMLTGIPKKMGCVHGGRAQPPCGTIAKIVLAVTLIADFRAVV